MNPIHQAALELQQYCQDREWEYCFIGGLAVQRWGEPRQTQDADLTLITGFGNEEVWVDSLLKRFRSRRDDARDFALRYRVLLLVADNGVPLDVALGAMPFEERSVARSSPWELAVDTALITCSAEDLIVHKVFAGRERDWLDIEGVLVAQNEAIQLKQVYDELLPLLEMKEDGVSEERLKTLCAKYNLRS